MRLKKHDPRIISILSILVFIAIALAGCFVPQTTVTIADPANPPGNEVPGEPAMSITITFHFEVVIGGPAAEGIELFIDQQANMPLISPIYFTQTIPQGTSLLYVFYAKNVGDTELTLSTLTGGDTPGSNMILTPSPATLVPGAILPYTLTIDVGSETAVGNYTGNFTILAT